MARTTLRVNKKRWDLFQRECQALFLRRDAYLNHALPGELDIFEQVPPCDEEGRAWLKESWARTGALLRDGTIPVAITLKPELIERLNTMCDEKRVPRDAFFNCFLDFITTRLIEPAVVIKDPRTEKDVASQLAAVLGDDEMNEDDVRWNLLDIAKAWGNKRNLVPLSPDYYREQLSYNQERVSAEKALLEDLDLAKLPKEATSW